MSVAVEVLGVFTALLIDARMVSASASARARPFFYVSFDLHRRCSSRCTVGCTAVPGRALLARRVRTSPFDVNVGYVAKSNFDASTVVGYP